VIRIENKLTVSWNDISDSVEEMLWGIGWSNEMKLLWVEKAWGGIVKNGLADYRDDLELHSVYIRLFSIVVLYGEFCSMTMEETFSPDFNEWMDNAELSPIRIGQMVGPSHNLDEFDTYNLIESSISTLTEKAKREVLISLIKEFGDINLLFVGLWLTYENLEEDIEQEDDEEEGKEGNGEYQLTLKEYDELISSKAGYVLNYDSTFSKMEAYTWLNGLS
jgi:phage protein U